MIVISFVKISLRRCHTLIGCRWALSHKIYYVKFSPTRPLGGGGLKKKGQKKIITQPIEEKKKNSCNLIKFVLVLLFALVERVGVSRMRDFFVLNQSTTKCIKTTQIFPDYFFVLLSPTNVSIYYLLSLSRRLQPASYSSALLGNHQVETIL